MNKERNMVWHNSFLVRIHVSYGSAVALEQLANYDLDAAEELLITHEQVLCTRLLDKFPIRNTEMTSDPIYLDYII